MMHLGDDFSRCDSFEELTPDQEAVLDQMGNDIEIERLENDAEMEIMFSMYEHEQISMEF
jgi:hypothetical protein